MYITNKLKCRPRRRFALVFRYGMEYEFEKTLYQFYIEENGCNSRFERCQSVWRKCAVHVYWKYE